MPRLSARVGRLTPSPTLAVAARAKELQQRGIDVLSFAAGEPDFDTPEVIRRAAIDALEAGRTRYVATLGEPAAREAIAHKLTSENRIPGLSFHNVAITAGAKHALYLVAQALFDPAEAGGPWECLLPVPSWVSYPPIVELAGGVIRPIRMTPEDGFKLTPAALRAAITPRSRAIILNTPSNPCGTMYAREEIEALASVVADAARTIAPELVVVTDEIYERIVFSGSPHVSPGSIPSIADRTITINGLSKAFAMTGWRIGYVACPGEWGRELIQAIGRLQDQMTGNITSFNYAAIPVALQQCAADAERMRQAFARRASIVHEGMTAIPDIRCTAPTAAFYAFPDVSAYFGRRTPGGKRIGTDIEFAEALLDEARIAVVPGSAFGGCGDRHIRISFACSEAQVHEGLARLHGFLSGLS